MPVISKAQLRTLQFLQQKPASRVYTSSRADEYKWMHEQTAVSLTPTLHKLFVRGYAQLQPGNKDEAIITEKGCAVLAAQGCCRRPTSTELRDLHLRVDETSRAYGQAGMTMDTLRRRLALMQTGAIAATPAQIAATAVTLDEAVDEMARAYASWGHACAEKSAALARGNNE